MAAIADGAVDPGVLSHGSGSFESQRALLRAVMCPDGPRRMLADASLAVDEARPDSQWHANALWLQSAAHLLLGNLETADEILGEAVADGEYGATLTVGAWALQAGIRIRRGDWDGAGIAADEARRRLVALGSGDLLSALAVFAVAARRGDPPAANSTSPVTVWSAPSWCGRWRATRRRGSRSTRCSRSHVPTLRSRTRRRPDRAARGGADRAPASALGILTAELDRDPGTARRLDVDAGRFVRPDERELRILPLLPTYLSFQDIADRLGVSRNTVKTHAMSIYGKSGRPPGARRSNVRSHWAARAVSGPRGRRDARPHGGRRQRRLSARVLTRSATRRSRPRLNGAGFDSRGWIRPKPRSSPSGSRTPPG